MLANGRVRYAGTVETLAERALAGTHDADTTPLHHAA
jgi:hypothetical protein